MRLLNIATLSNKVCSHFARSQSSWDTLMPHATRASAARSSGEQCHSPSLPATPSMGGSRAARCPWLVHAYLAHRGGAQSGWQAQAARGRHLSKCTMPSTAPRGWPGPAAAAACPWVPACMPTQTPAGGGPNTGCCCGPWHCCCCRHSRAGAHKSLKSLQASSSMAQCALSALASSLASCAGAPPPPAAPAPGCATTGTCCSADTLAAALAAAAALP